MHLRQKVRLRPELSPQFLSTSGRTRTEKLGPTYNSGSNIRILKGKKKMKTKLLLVGKISEDQSTKGSLTALGLKCVVRIANSIFRLRLLAITLVADENCILDADRIKFLAGLNGFAGLNGLQAGFCTSLL